MSMIHGIKVIRGETPLGVRSPQWVRFFVEFSPIRGIESYWKDLVGGLDGGHVAYPNGISFRLVDDAIEFLARLDEYEFTHHKSLR